MNSYAYSCSWLLQHCYAVSACNKKNDYKEITSDPFLYSKTVKELNNVVMQNNFPPIIASRNYLYANIAAYEVIAAGYPRSIPITGRPG